MLNNIVSKAFCINLYFRQDRWQSAASQFSKQGLNVERFNAIDGREFKTKYQAKPGNCGCNLSHFLIIQQAKMMGLDAIMVFEDDVILRELFVKKMDDILADLPEQWDMLLLGGSHRKPATPVTDKIYQCHETYCSHAYIMHWTAYDFFLQRLQNFDQPMDCFFPELQAQGYCFVTNPPMAWQQESYSDIEGRVMRYDHLKSNEQ